MASPRHGVSLALLRTFVRRAASADGDVLLVSTTFLPPLVPKPKPPPEAEEGRPAIAAERTHASPDHAPTRLKSVACAAGAGDAP